MNFPRIKIKIKFTYVFFCGKKESKFIWFATCFSHFTEYSSQERKQMAWTNFFVNMLIAYLLIKGLMTFARRRIICGILSKMSIISILVKKKEKKEKEKRKKNPQIILNLMHGYPQSVMIAICRIYNKIFFNPRMLKFLYCL